MSEYAHPDVVIDTRWLHDHLNDPNVRIIEVEGNPEHYKNAHIRGAVFWNIFTDLLLPNLSLNLDAIAFSKLMSRSGISPETIVIAYGSYPGMGGWIFWLLNVLGHHNVRVLNGGYQKWLAEGRPLVSELSNFPPTEYPIQSSNRDIRVFYPEIQASVHRSDRIILDVRTSQEYCGEWFFDRPPTDDQRTGHIPHAIHLEHILTLNNDGTFKSVDELQKLYHDRGITPDKEVFPYCAIGGRSGYIWFVLKYLLGYPKVRNYDGSWNEWSRHPDLLIEK